MLVQPTGQLIVTADGLKGLVDTEDDKRRTQIIGEEPKHVQETTLFAVAARRPFNCLGCHFVRTMGCFRFGTKMEVNMHWRITVEAVDPTGEEYRKEFLVEKNLDELTDGRIGFSIDDGKTVMAECLAP